MNELLKLVLSLSLGGSLMALLILGIRLILGKKLPSTFYYYALVLVLLRLIVPLPGLMRLERAETLSADSTVMDSSSEAGGRIYQTQLPSAADPVIHSDGYISTDTGIVSISQQEVLYEEPTVDSAIPIEAINLSMLLIGFMAAAMSLCLALAESGRVWVVIWAIGATATLVWYVLGYLHFSRALKRTLKSPDIYETHLFNWMGGCRRLRLRRSAAVSTPMLIGLLHPILVIPDMIYSENMLRDILRHELTHYKRKDLIIKWVAVLVTAIHWFNPIVHIVRRELDRACEMSCDERLLRTMDRDAKQQYGETLLSMASNNPLPKRLVATTFATQKRNLKERLEQIMTYKHMGRATLALMLVAALLLVGCGTAVGPNSGDTQEPDNSAAPAQVETEEETLPPMSTVTVSTVDEFLSAIAPNTEIILKGGTYNLFEASGYGYAGTSDYYTWENVYPEGYQLNIVSVDRLSIVSEDGKDVTILAQPRYANVLDFERCTNLELSGLTVGHTDGGECSGGVVQLSGVDKASITDCKLFGCGTIGVIGIDSTQLRILDTEIYECSWSGTQISQCQDVLFDGCKFYNNSQYGGYVAQLVNSDNVAIINSEIHDNDSSNVIYSSYSTNVYFAGNAMENNSLSSGVIFIEGSPITIEACSFGDSGAKLYGEALYMNTASLKAIDPSGNELEESDLQAMKLSHIEGWTANISQVSTPAAKDDGYIHVSTVDEFLAAIGDNARIYLEDGVYDLSTATDYGGFGSGSYRWSDTGVGGPQLVISNVTAMSIVGSDTARVVIQAVPRYAEVLAFENCQLLSLQNITVGHTEAPSQCTGGVLYFYNSTDIDIGNCSLYGCGVYGITAISSSYMKVTNTEIYDCMYGDLNLSDSSIITFENCNFHDNGLQRVISECGGVTMDGKELTSYEHLSFSEIGAQVIENNNSVANAYICYSYLPVSEISLPLGTALELQLQILGGDTYVDGYLDASWQIDGSPNNVKLSQLKYGRCTLENLGVTSGSVTLTAQCSYEGKDYQQSITVNLVDEVTNSTTYPEPTPTPA